MTSPLRGINDEMTLAAATHLVPHGAMAAQPLFPVCADVEAQQDHCVIAFRVSCRRLECESA
ncbi:MAG: hypothetical protein Q4G70_13405 [Pseudomonadota bacterium]|nr:hypothetical protein [Pseudomonadota bacterium]